ncbi:ALP1-like protein, partial [Tanacetum coccineum]
SLGKVARERIPGELSPSNYPGRHVARDTYPQRHVARESVEMSLGIVPVSVSKCFVRPSWSYGEEFLRKPTYTDMTKLYAYHEEKHVFPGMLGSIDCTYWLWENCPVAFKAQFFPLFNDLKSEKAPDVSFVANNVPNKRGYYLTDRIYPQWPVLIKSIKNPGTNDHKRILYKTKHEATRKYVERAFGSLKKKWKLIKHLARGMSRRRLSDVMYTCIILHNMIIHDNEVAICSKFFREEQQCDDDPLRTHQESMEVTWEIINRTTHLSLKADLVEHILKHENQH